MATLSKLEQFLAKNQVTDLKQEVKLGTRFGELVFEIKGMLNEEYNGYVQRATSYVGSGAKRTPKINNKALMSSIILGQTVNPDFRKAEFLESLGVTTPEDAINAVLNAGEVQALGDEIFKLSGFGQTFEEEIEEAKN